MESHPVTVEAHPGANYALPESIDSHPWAKECQSLAWEGHPGAAEALPKSSGGSPWAMETTPWHCGGSSWNLGMLPKFVEFILKLCRLSWRFAGCCGAAVGQLGALEGCHGLPGISRGSPWSYCIKAYKGAVEALIFTF
jgi:hypothetical protein